MIYTTNPPEPRMYPSSRGSQAHRRLGFPLPPVNTTAGLLRLLGPKAMKARWIPTPIGEGLLIRFRCFFSLVRIFPFLERRGGDIQGTVSTADLAGFYRCLSMMELLGSGLHSSVFVCLHVGSFRSMLFLIDDNCYYGEPVLWGLRASPTIPMKNSR